MITLLEIKELYERLESKHYNVAKVGLRTIINREETLITCSKEKEVIPIDVDLIYEMRKRGLGFEARELLNLYRKSIKDEQHEINLELDRKEYHIKKTMGLCVNKSCTRPAADGKVTCEHHLNKYREYYRKKKKVKDE